MQQLEHSNNSLRDSLFQKIFVKIRKIRSEPRIQNISLDSSELLEIQKQILSEKRMLKEVFEGIYDTCINLDNKLLEGEGDSVEIGAGISFFKNKYPHIISTDIKEAPHLDMALDAQDMPFKDSSIRSIYGINCFHHIPNPERFFNELDRVISPNGGAILIDPFHGPLAEKGYKKVFDSEFFDKNQKKWSTDNMSAMYGANQALSYIVFNRDRELFEQKFPNLKIIYKKPLHNYIRYLISGGLNFKPLLPDMTIPLIKMIELMLMPFDNILALYQVIVLKKVK